jgi:hypothetical protein
MNGNSAKNYFGKFKKLKFALPPKTNTLPVFMFTMKQKAK